MNDMDFEIFRALLEKESGIIITPEKTYLLESRLNPIAKDLGFSNLSEMASKLRGPVDPVVQKAVIEAMTTNESYFFRDTKPFDIFEKTLLPHISNARPPGQPLRIWSAACSSGQEPYSLAMILLENKAKLGGRKIEIIGTDLSDDILEIAKKGVYNQFEVQRGLPTKYLIKYFEKSGDSHWVIKEDVKSMVDYSHFNLLDPLDGLGKFDLIFCRNVLIYFNLETKKMILERMHKILNPEGVLCLGGAESVLGITDQFVPIPDLRGMYAAAGQEHKISVAK